MVKEDKKNIVESITMEDEEEDNSSINNSTLQDTIKELSTQAFKHNPKKLTHLTPDNSSGIIQVECLNEYMEQCYGRRYEILDCLVENKCAYSMSHSGFGIGKLIELLRSIQASFEQTAITPRINEMLRR